MPTSFTIGVRARRFGAPTGPGQPTAMSLRAETAMTVSTGGLGDNAITYNAGLVDIRADTNALVTTANGPVSLLSSAQGLTGSFAQPNTEFQPAHSDANDWIAFAAPAQADTATADHLESAAIAAHSSNNNYLGVAYVLFQVAAVPSWTSTLLRIGANSSTYNQADQRAVRVLVLGNGVIQVRRGGSATADTKTLELGAIVANQWLAIAVVINDSRNAGTVNGTADRLTRGFLKTKPGGAYPTMVSAVASAPGDLPFSANVAEIGRERWNNSSSRTNNFNGLRLHSFGFDRQPPITDAAIENNLDKLLARV